MRLLYNLVFPEWSNNANSHYYLNRGVLGTFTQVGNIKGPVTHQETASLYPRHPIFNQAWWATTHSSPGATLSFTAQWAHQASHYSATLFLNQKWSHRLAILMPHCSPKVLEKEHNPATVKSHTPPMAAHYFFFLVYKNAYSKHHFRTLLKHAVMLIDGNLHNTLTFHMHHGSP